MNKFALITTLAIAMVFATGACKRGSGGDKAGGNDNKSSTKAAANAGGMSEDVKKGQKLFINNTCATCHGNTGKGDGPAGLALRPKPRNFRQLASYKQGSKLEDIVETIKSGVPGTNMQSFKHISEADRTLIAKYVIYLQKN